MNCLNMRLPKMKGDRTTNGCTGPKIAGEPSVGCHGQDIMGTLEKKIRITLDTGCVNTNPDIYLDKLFELHENGVIEIYVPDGVIKNILDNEYKLTDIDQIPDTPSGIKVKQRLSKIVKCSVLRGTLLCGDDVYGRVGGTAGGKATEAYEQIIEIIIGSSEFDYEDIRILLLHLIFQNDFFITKNTRHFIDKGRREKFSSELNVVVKTPDEFLSYYTKKQPTMVSSGSQRPCAR